MATRLGDIAKETPKCMLDVNGKPFLLYQLEQLKKFGIKDIILCTGHLSNVIEDYFGDGKKFGLNIVYSKETEPLGTGGAIKNAEKLIDDDFIAINGDGYCDINFKELIKFYKEKKAKAVITSMVIKDCSDYGTIELDSDNKILAFIEKQKKFNGFINIGFYVLSKDVLEKMPKGKVSIEYDVFPKVVNENKAYSFIYKGKDWVDIGVPERYEYFKKLIKGEKNDN